jgi:sulfonate transport system ATP-binding protein
VTRQGVSLRISGLGKSFGSRRVLAGIDLEVEDGALLAIVGRSGCGKSTLLRVIAGLERADEGGLTLDGVPGTGMHSDVRMIFQDARLLPWASVLANVALGARLELRGKRATREREARARELLGQVGLADRAADWPAALSGGQKQRVALARGLMSEPRLLLLDEPLGALDALTRLEMQQLIERLWTSRRFTAVLVTHDIHEAVALADQVIVLRDGAIAARVELAMDRPRVREDRKFVETSADLLDHILQSPTASAPPPSPLDYSFGGPPLEAKGLHPASSSAGRAFVEGQRLAARGRT